MTKTKNKTYHTITAIRIITTTMIIAITPQKRWFNVDRSTVTDYYVDLFLFEIENLTFKKKGGSTWIAAQ